jgi:putative phosphoribosyl transferase
MLAAVSALRPKAPAKIIAAIPVGSRSAVRSVGEVADLVVCPAIPVPFYAVGAAYKDFRQLSDDEVQAILQRY